MQKLPIIGITTGEINNKVDPWSPIVHGQSQTYVNAIIQAGGAPLLIPLTTDESVLRSLYSMLDGVFFAGGNDLNPHLYGQEPHECVTDYSDLRDTTEAKLMKWALEDQKPILAVCRGMQLLNIHYGGTLYQHIPDDLPHAYDHDASNKAKTLVDTSHLLRIEESSQLAKILGATTIGTNEHHHQAINKSGKGIVITAWASDGIIEALELPDHPYAIGIQSHPESLTIVEPRWAKLFASFVEATQS